MTRPRVHQDNDILWRNQRLAWMYAQDCRLINNGTHNHGVLEMLQVRHMTDVLVQTECHRGR